MNKSEYIIIRHGETQWNLKSRKQGHLDSPLTLKGIEQVRNVSNKLKNIIKNRKIILVCSPLFRAKQTVSIICEKLGFDYDNCIYDNLLKEHSFGLWEGKNEIEIEKLYPDELKVRSNNRWDYTIPNGESYDLLYNRIKRLFDKYKNNFFIFITHEMVSKVIRGYYGNLDNDCILKLNHNHNNIYHLIQNEIIKI